MHRRVQPILILALMITLCLAALPRVPGPSATADPATPAMAQEVFASSAELIDDTGKRAHSVLAEFDMPFFSFAGITRPRL